MDQGRLFDLGAPCPRPRREDLPGAEVAMRSGTPEEKRSRAKVEILLKVGELFDWAETDEELVELVLFSLSAVASRPHRLKNDPDLLIRATKILAREVTYAAAVNDRWERAGRPLFGTPEYDAAMGRK